MNMEVSYHQSIERVNYCKCTLYTKKTTKDEKIDTFLVKRYLRYVGTIQRVTRTKYIHRKNDIIITRQTGY